ncbi:MAG: ribonuclease D [Pseudomonadales bacterium]
MLDRHIDHPLYIESDQELSRLCAQWANVDLLALDTEFIRTDTFYPIGALVQVSVGGGCFLIDPLAISDFSPFIALLADENIVKVVHACSEDLEVFDRLFGVLPRPLIDTQIAAALDGYGFSLGYQRLTEALLQVHVPKGETRSNWLQRPLTGSQIHYAALDVAYLPEMYQLLTDSLQEKGRLAWLQEECNVLVNTYADTEKIAQYYKKVKSCWKLLPSQLAVLQALIQWREMKAREKDVPRGRVLKDCSCFDIARMQPQTLKALSQIDEVGPKTIRQFGETILDTIEQAQSIAEDEWPERLPRPLPSQTAKLLKILKAHVCRRAEQLQLAQELLAKKRDYEALLRSGVNGGEYRLPESLSGWRKEVVGNELIDLLGRE